MNPLFDLLTKSELALELDASIAELDAKQATIAAQSARIAELEAALALFVGAIEPCDHCDEGTNPFSGYDCSVCGGVGLQIASQGQLYREAYPAANKALQKGGGNG